jgi:hypothetical protein
MVTASPKDLRRPALAVGALLALACGHTDPFSAPPYGITQPFDPAPPVRLTLNQAADRGPSWLPDGSGILYSAQQLGRPDADVCLAELPAGGGTQRRLICDLTSRGSDTTNAIESPTVGEAGRLAFVKASSSIGGQNPFREEVAVAQGLDPASASEVQRIGYTIPGEPQHSAVTHLRWQSATSLAWVGSAVAYRRTCAACRADTIVTGLKAVVADLSAPDTPPVAVPGTEYASGVSPGPSADELYYTVGGDGRVFRRLLSSGDVSVVHDFGPGAIVRDVHLVGGRLAAVVGGRVTFSADPILGPTQWDSGGVVHLVELSSGADVTLGGLGAVLFRRPALAPAGDRLVAEGYPLILQNVIDPATGNHVVDTTVDRTGDLYLFTLP